MRKNLGVLRYPADRWPLAVVALAFVMCIVPLFHAFAPLPLAGYWLVVFVLRRIATAAQHGHAHLSVFRSSKILNFVYDTLLAHETGLTTPEWELHHNRGHHRDYRNPAQDVFSVFDPETGRPVSRWRYSIGASLRCWGDSIRIAKEAGPVEKKNLLGRFWAHLAVQAGLIAVFTLINPAMGLLFAVLQTFTVRCSVAWSSYWHHFEVPMTVVYDSSRTLLDPLHNRLSFNSGHHTAHHEKPTLHWSLLPARTEAIRHLIPESCLRNQDAPLAS